jgi:hypothetical protein
MGKTSRAVIPGSRLFNTLFGLPRTGKNIIRSLATIQSGSPPVRRSPKPRLLTPYSKYFANRSLSSARARNRMLLTAGTVVRITRAISS